MGTKESMFVKQFQDAPNEVLDGDGFYISYNPSARNDIFGVFASLIGEEDESTEETALLDRSGVWYILKGDFRKEYLKAAPKGLEACLKVYNKHKATKRSGWSTDK